MKHTISLTVKDYIEICFIGPIEFEHVRTLGERLVVLNTQLGDMGKDLLLSIDSRNATEMEEEAVSLARIILKHTAFIKMACIETRGDVTKKLAEEITGVHGTDKVRVYKTFKEAQIWLDT